MTRKEEIAKESKKFAKEIDDWEIAEDVQDAFEQGAQWADSHPHWLSVEDELPKLNSGMVIVVSYKGEIDFMIYSNSGWHNSKRWCCVKGVITHWMPLPAPPKKGGKE